MIIRDTFKIFTERLLENRKFIQCIVGPRQVGKTTMVTSVLEKIDIPFEYYIAGDNDNQIWISSLWETARTKMRINKIDELIIAIDEIQKIVNWSEIIKKEWDSDTTKNINIKLVLLGSSRLLIQHGLTESLAGRFEMIQMTHWSFSEMHEGFGLTPEEYAWFGGYPGSATLIKDEKRWKDYIQNSLIETTISKDILMLTRITKPALLKQLFYLSASYSGQIISFNKLLGQLQDAGNTTTLSHYLHILDTAGLSKGIQKIYKEDFRTKSSIPKLQVYNTALISGQTSIKFEEAYQDKIMWGRIVESCVGAHLINNSIKSGYEVLYWRHINDEIDFVLKYEHQIVGIEVKSNKAKPTKGMESFAKVFLPLKIILIDNKTLSWQDFIKIDPLEWFK